jgi:hypothetical protein
MVPLEKNLDTLTRVLNQVGVIGAPGLSVVMAKKDSQFFPSTYAAAGDNCAKGEVSKGRVGKSAVVHRRKIRFLRGNTFSVKRVKNVFVDAREICREKRVL